MEIPQHCPQCHQSMSSHPYGGEIIYRCLPCQKIYFRDGLRTKRDASGRIPAALWKRLLLQSCPDCHADWQAANFEKRTLAVCRPCARIMVRNADGRLYPAGRCIPDAERAKILQNLQ